jgi:hypothetical protein
MRHTSKIALLIGAVAVLTHSGTATAQSRSTLKLTATGAGATIQAEPSGRLIGCSGLTCTYEYPTGTPVTVSAASTAGATLATWEGGCGGTAPTCGLVVSGARAVAARFTPVLVYADEQTGKGTVRLEPSYPSCGVKCWAVPYGTSVVLRATPASGFKFDGWYGGCANVRVTGCRFNAMVNRMISPIFACATSTCSIGQPLSHQVEITVTVKGTGYVQVNGKDCRVVCSPEFKRGKTIVLRALGGRFLRWERSCRGTSGRCQFPAFRDSSGQPPRIDAVFG